MVVNLDKVRVNTEALKILAATEAVVVDTVPLQAPVLVTINNNSNLKLQTWTTLPNQKPERWQHLPNHRMTKMKVGEMLELSLTELHYLILSKVTPYSYYSYKNYKL